MFSIAKVDRFYNGALDMPSGKFHLYRGEWTQFNH